MLYHASPNKNLAILEPKRTLSKDRFVGNFVFATSDRKLAAMYLANNGVPVLLNVKEGPRIIICSNADTYIQNDKGGAIYEVPADSFQPTPQAGLEDSEVVSEVPVVPLNKTIYQTSLDAMKEMGVQVYFVAKDVFDEIVKNKNESEIVAKLKPYIK
jgi:hypothetical protein